MHRHDSPRVNTEWFRNAFTASQYGSLNKIAPHVRTRSGKPMAPTSLSGIINGKMAMTGDVAFQLAKLLHIPSTEIFKQAGLTPPETDFSAVPLIGTVSEDGRLALSQKKRDMILSPFDVPETGIAVRYNADGNNVDGWVLFCEPPAPLTATAYGRLAVIWPAKGHPGVALVGRGYKKNTVNLLKSDVCALPPAKDVAISEISPVLWIRPPQ